MAADNGLRKFVFHAEDPGAPAPIDPLMGATTGAERSAPAKPPASLSPEAAARRYLNAAIARDDLGEISAEPVSGEAPEFDLISVETVPLTKSRAVKFRQRFHKIPVYGSLVTVELGTRNELLAILSALGQPDVSPIASIAPADALAAVREAAGVGDTAGEWAPQLQFFYHSPERGWRLVYVFEDVAIGRDRAAESGERFSDFIVDAHSGEVLSELPRLHELTEVATDGMGTKRPIRVIPASTPGRRMLVDTAENVQTYDFGFRSYLDHFQRLPGTPVETADQAWPADAVSAHYNASTVAGFLRRTLMRDGIDDRGGAYVSTIRCIEDPPGPEWRNAAWVPGRSQMIYGQRRLADGALRSYALALDIVAHEFFHGVTSSTARIMYSGQSGALNESLSDIFGVIVSNYRGSRRRRLDLWDWEIGEDLPEDGGPALRDLGRPARFGQPEHMDDYRDLPEAVDHGGVHTNSGIHNKAGYLMLTARRAPGTATILAPTEVAALFYLGVTQFLSRTSTFADSRAGVVLAAHSLFRNAADKDERIRVVEQSFEAVGIV